MNNPTEIIIKLEREKPDVEDPKQYVPTGVQEAFPIIEPLGKTIEHINSMYEDALNQSRKSFAGSIGFSISGLGMLIALILYYVISESVVNWIIILSGFTSIILQIIGGTIFILHARSVKQIYYFGERMTKIYESLIANYFADGIQNETKRDETKSLVAIETVSRRLSEPSKIDENKTL